MFERFFLLLTLTFSALFGCASKGIKSLYPHYVLDCTILDSQGVLFRKYPGSRCAFLSDGSLVSGLKKELVFYNPDMTVKWRHPVDTHHQLNMSADEKEILVMTSSVHRVGKTDLRFDVLQIYDRNGILLKSMDTFDYRKELYKEVPASRQVYFTISEDMLKHVSTPGVTKEFSHANSFVEIEANELEKTSAVFSKGHYLINFNCLGLVVVMDSDLKKILWSKAHYSEEGFNPSWHDVQMKKDGWLLIYNNNSLKVNGRPSSSLDELHPLTGERKILYRAEPAEDFYSDFAGGVQILENKNILYSEVLPHGRFTEITPQGQKIRSIDSPYLDDVTKKPEAFLQIRALNLTSFLSYNSGYL